MHVTMLNSMTTILYNRYDNDIEKMRFSRGEKKSKQNRIQFQTTNHSTVHLYYWGLGIHLLTEYKILKILYKRAYYTDDIQIEPC